MALMSDPSSVEREARIAEIRSDLQDGLYHDPTDPPDVEYSRAERNVMWLLGELSRLTAELTGVKRDTTQELEMVVGIWREKLTARDRDLAAAREALQGKCSSHSRPEAICPNCRSIVLDTLGRPAYVAWMHSLGLTLPEDVAQRTPDQETPP